MPCKYQNAVVTHDLTKVLPGLVRVGTVTSPGPHSGIFTSAHGSEANGCVKVVWFVICLITVLCKEHQTCSKPTAAAMHVLGSG